MAALAWPAIEAIAIRALAAIGIGALGKAATDAAKDAQGKRQEEEEGKTGPIPPALPVPRTGSGSDTSTKDKAKRKKCEECPPDKGHTTVRKQSWSPQVVAYQVRICGLPYGPGWITEWSFAGVEFDGFDSSQCLLKEAKSTYDQFFDEFGLPIEWWARSTSGELGLIEQARKQDAVANPQPPVALRWYFMEPVSFGYFSGVFAVRFPRIQTVHES